MGINQKAQIIALVTISLCLLKVSVFGSDALIVTPVTIDSTTTGSSCSVAATTVSLSSAKDFSSSYTLRMYYSEDGSAWSWFETSIGGSSMSAVTLMLSPLVRLFRL